MKYHLSQKRPRWQAAGTIFLFIFLVSLALALFYAPKALACGDISAPPLPWGEVTGPYDVERITDCTNPFGRNTEGLPRGVGITVDGIGMPDDGSLTISASGTRNYSYGINELAYAQVGWFLHTERGYEFVDQSPSSPNRSDIEALADAFFTDGTPSEPYIEAVISGTYYVEGDDNGLMFAFADYIFENYVPINPLLLPGTYTILIVDLPPLPVWHRPDSWLMRLRDFLVPTAYAAIPTSGFVYTHTITLIAETPPPPPPPSGASSVLFLPGIQASRLYTDGLLGTENQIWEPNVNSDMEKLAMTESGLSVNDVYTKDVIDEIALPTVGANIYKGFLGELSDLVAAAEIKEYRDFAYDWRFSVFDIAVSGTKYENEVRSLIDAVEDLATNSFTGKVTIIGHSNGGLLAKVLISELERLDLEDLVDKVVFVGTPQLGTPKAIGVLLHGLDQQKLGGLVIDDETSRSVSRNMPGVYALLPSQKYFDLTGDTLITSDESSTTEAIRAYGDVNSLDQVVDFVLDTQNQRGDDVPIYEPSTLNTEIMNAMLERRDELDNWLAPEGIEVYEVVGTGLATIKGIEYRQFPCVSSLCLLDDYSYMKPYPLMTSAGDGTVVDVSSGAYGGEKIKVSTALINENFFGSEYGHANLTEVPVIKDFLSAVIKYPYLETELVIPDEYTAVSDTDYTIIGVHSPVTISLVSDTGKEVGRSGDTVKTEIPGSQYFEFAESKYIVVPKNTNYTATVKGTGAGVYSLTIDNLSASNVQSSVYRYYGASTTASMTAEFVASSTGFGTIKTDTNSDGAIDLEQFLDGTLVPPIVITFSYEDLRQAIVALKLSRSREKVLLLQVAVAKHVQQLPVSIRLKQVLELIAIQNLEQTIRQYGRKQYLTTSQVDELLFIIRNLD